MAPAAGLFRPALSCLNAADSFYGGALPAPPDFAALFAISAAAVFAARFVLMIDAFPGAAGAGAAAGFLAGAAAADDSLFAAGGFLTDFSAFFAMGANCSPMLRSDNGDCGHRFCLPRDGRGGHNVRLMMSEEGS
jgi:hypothetical protein